MIVRELRFESFRNLQSGTLTPVTGVNVLYGDNAQGKTNLLEALWLFTGGKSFRGSRDSELPGFGKEKAHLILTFEAAGRVQEAELTIVRRRQAVLNGVVQPSPSRLAGQFCAVVFSPADLSLVREGPDARRRFLDAAYCQLRPGYIATLSEYHRALAQRNALLKNGPLGLGAEELLDVWDQKLARAGGYILAARRRYTDRLAAAAGALYQGLSGGKEILSLSYRRAGEECGETDSRSVREETEALYRLLCSRRAADQAAGFTTAGPHRDDLIIEINQLPARAFGSQGQQRSAALALKLAEAALLEEATGEKPVALLDDVMSELDAARQDYILDRIEDWQVFITCCEPGTVLRLDRGNRNSRAWSIRAGTLTEEKGENGSVSAFGTGSGGPV